MSYSNDWSISGISGISSLKECYKSGGVPILDNVGCPRLDVNGNPNFGTAIQIDGAQPMTVYTDLKHYHVPKYFINNHDFIAYGHTDLDEGLQSGNFTYSQNIQYKAGNERSAAKWWNYDCVPIILFDSLTQAVVDKTYTYESDTGGFLLTVTSGSSIEKVCFIPQTLIQGVYKIEEPRLQIMESYTTISTQPYYYYPEYNSSKCNVVIYNQNSYQFSTTYSTRGGGWHVIYEHIFRTNKRYLDYVKLYGSDMNTDGWSEDLFRFEGYGIYSCGHKVLPQQVTLDVDNSTGEWSLNTSLEQTKYTPQWSGHPSRAFSTDSYYHYYINMPQHAGVYSKTWHQKNTNSHDCILNVLCSQSLYITAPKYVWCYSDNHTNYTSFNTFTKDNIDGHYEFTHSTYTNSESSATSDGYPFSPFGRGYTTGTSQFYERLGSSVDFSDVALRYTSGEYATTSGTGMQFSRVALIKGYYLGTVTMPFPYDNTGNTSPITIDVSNMHRYDSSSTVHYLLTDNGSRHFNWVSCNPIYDSTLEMSWGLVRAYEKPNESEWTRDAYYPYVLSRFYTPILLDPSITLATSTSVPNRQAVVGFVKEPMWFERTANNGYQLRTLFNNIADEYPLKFNLPIWTQNGAHTVTITFDGSAHQYTVDDNGVSLQGTLTITASNYLSFYYNNREVGFENVYASLLGTLRIRTVTITVSPSDSNARFSSMTGHLLRESSINATITSANTAQFEVITAINSDDMFIFDEATFSNGYGATSYGSVRIFATSSSYQATQPVAAYSPSSCSVRTERFVESDDDYTEFYFDSPNGYVTSFESKVYGINSSNNYVLLSNRTVTVTDVDEYFYTEDDDDQYGVEYVLITATDLNGNTFTVEWGSRPVAIVNVTLDHSAAVLTSIIGTYRGVSVSPTSFSGHTATFEVNFITLNKGPGYGFEVTSLTTSNNYVLQSSDFPNIYAGNTYSVTAYVSLYDWSTVSNIYRTDDGDPDTPDYYYNVDCATGYIKSYTGTVIDGNNVSHSISDSDVPQYATEVTLYVQDYWDPDIKYIEVYLTNRNNQADPSRPRTYGTKPMCTVLATLDESSATFNSASGYTHTGSTRYNATIINSGRTAKFEIPFVDLGSNTYFTIDTISSTGYTLDEPRAVVLGEGQTINTTLPVTLFSWDGVSEIDTRDGTDHGQGDYDTDYYMTVPKGYISSYSGYYVNYNCQQVSFSGSVSSYATDISLCEQDYNENSFYYVEVTLTNVYGATRTYHLGSRPQARIIVNSNPSYLTGFSYTYNGTTYTNGSADFYFDFTGKGRGYYLNVLRNTVTASNNYGYSGSDFGWTIQPGNTYSTTIYLTLYDLNNFRLSEAYEDHDYYTDYWIQLDNNTGYPTIGYEYEGYYHIYSSDTYQFFSGSGSCDEDDSIGGWDNETKDLRYLKVRVSYNGTYSSWKEVGTLPPSLSWHSVSPSTVTVDGHIAGYLSYPIRGIRGTVNCNGTNVSVSGTFNSNGTYQVGQASTSWSEGDQWDDHTYTVYVETGVGYTYIRVWDYNYWGDGAQESTYDGYSEYRGASSLEVYSE